MPIVRVEIWKGRPEATKRALANAITQAVVEHIGCAPAAVTVILDEVEKTNWYIGDKNGQDLRPDL